MLLLSLAGNAQELFVYTEPASNMAAKSVGLRLNNYFKSGTGTNKSDYYLVPEIMLGISKNLMIHGDVFLANRSKSLAVEGASVYAKYRFLSHDDVQRHFRMAAYTRYSFNNSPIHQEEINLYGHNTGYEAGVIATQLLHKVALSSGLSIIKALDNGPENPFLYGKNNSKAISYTFSAGKLILPRQYTDYKQVNLNLMLELLNQFNLGSGRYYSDIAPSAQFIFNSVARVDIGYRQQVSGSLYRVTPNGLFIRLEYNLFNVF